jgi:hypothetical protein
VRTAFSEGIYHGAALSAVADGKGGMHLVYKDNAERLRYRHFDGQRFESSLMVQDDGDWALQPAVTRVGSTVYIFYNRPHRDGRGYDLVVRKLSGRSLGSARELASISGFAGYPASVGVLSSGVKIPCLFGLEPKGGSDRLAVVFAPSSGSSKSDADGAVAEAPGGEDAVMVDLPGAELAASVLAPEPAPEEAAGCGGGQALAVLVGLPMLALERRRRKSLFRR